MNELQRFFMTSPVGAQGVAEALWLIIALPLFGAFLCGVFGRWLGRANVNLIACAAVFGSFLLSVLALWTINDQSTLYVLSHDYGTWFSAGSFQVRFGLHVDHLSAALLLVITGVGFLIHVYSTEYMSHDPGYWRYFAYLNLFVANMLTLVLGDNLILTFVGWEGVGYCSYLLIGFWYTDDSKAWAGRKAFITNRIGDFGFVVAMMLLVLWVGAFGSQARQRSFAGPNRLSQSLEARGPLNYTVLETAANAMPTAKQPGRVSLEDTIATGPLQGRTFGGVLTAILLLLLLGAAGKSAQIPLYVWLPDAMAGPTPVSALIHAATMVTAGVYLFCRLSFLLVLSPVAMAAVALIGASTALLAALIAFAQDDIKKVLAYSTISQLGFMFMAVGLGVFWAAVLHLVTHAFFKACLFLGAGSIMHGNAEETDIKKLGGLWREMPWTAGTFLVATLAITGIVPLSGFFSKDAILHGIHGTQIVQLPWVNELVWKLGLVAAFCTAFYMSRLYLLTFTGKRSPEAKVAHAHESAWPMTGPLVVLAILSVVGLLYGLPLIETGAGRPTEVVLENYLAPVFRTAHNVMQSSWFHIEEGNLWAAWLTAIALAWAGGLAAVGLYRFVFPARRGKKAPMALAAIRSFTQHKFYVDELYGIFIAAIRGISVGLYRFFDTKVIDGLVRGLAWGVAGVGGVLRYFQTGDVQSYAAVMAIAALCGVAYLLRGYIGFP